MTTQDERRRALESVNEWFRSIEWREGDPTPFKYKDSEQVMYEHGETIRQCLQERDQAGLEYAIEKLGKAMLTTAKADETAIEYVIRIKNMVSDVRSKLLAEYRGTKEG